jgi:hypothetical protein
MPTGPEDEVFYGVSGHCMRKDGNGENGINCVVYVVSSGLPHPYFYSNVSHYDPVQGNGFYACSENTSYSPPADGTWLFVKGFTGGGSPWGVSSQFQWSAPNETGITVYAQ